MNKSNFYVIELQNSIDELLEYRINRGYKLVDGQNIFVRPSTIAGRKLVYKDKTTATTTVEAPAVISNRNMQIINTEALDSGVSLDD